MPVSRWPPAPAAEAAKHYSPWTLYLSDRDAKRVAKSGVKACEYEDGSGQRFCVWRADKAGNGEGQSFLHLAHTGKVTKREAGCKDAALEGDAKRVVKRWKACERRYGR